MSLNQINEQIGRHRWTICALIFAATTINYLDRNVLGLLKPVLTAGGVFGDEKSVELNYSRVVICFQVAYAVFCAETSGAITIVAATFGGIPVSTTHTITGAIVGVGATRRLSAVKWGVAGRIVWAWVLTIPLSAGIAAASYWLVVAMH